MLLASTVRHPRASAPLDLICKHYSPCCLNIAVAQYKQGALHSPLSVIRGQKVLRNQLDSVLEMDQTMLQ